MSTFSNSATRRKLVFDEEEMTSDPEPKAPTVRLVEVSKEDDGAPEEPSNRAKVWFDSNKNTRVPVIALEEDVYRIPDQNYACFSVIRPEDYGVLHHQDGSYRGSLIKFRGVFKSREEADHHIRRVMKADKHFDVHLVPCFTWAGMDDHAIEDREYANSEIAEIMKGYFSEENNRMKGVRERIRATQANDPTQKIGWNEEAGGAARSSEATEFFMKAIEEEEDRPPPRPANAKPLTLSELAESLDITPRGETVMTKTIAEEIPREKLEAVVSEILLDDDEEEEEE